MSLELKKNVELKLETKFFMSNFDTYMSTEDDYLITLTKSLIKVDFSDELSEKDYFDGVSNFQEVGNISIYRLDLDYSLNRLAILSDLISQDLCFACSFFFYGEETYLSSKYLYYVDEVFIKPEFRGFGFGIKGLAMFLQNFAVQESVCCHPCPILDLSEKYSNEQKRGRLLMRKYWSKLGLDRYSESENILWTNNWQIPSWLKSQIFSST